MFVPDLLKKEVMLKKEVNLGESYGDSRNCI